MKKLLLSASAIALATFAGSAFAADLPSRKAPVLFEAPAAPLWTGFYVGLNAGYTFSNTDTLTNSYWDTGAAGFGGGLLNGAFPGAFNLKNDGFIGGGQIGYNYQFGSIVAGFEADIQGVAGASNSASYFFPGNAAFVPAVTQASRSLDYLGTARARVGYLFTPTVLAYVTGGLAYGQATVKAGYFGPAFAPPLAIGSSFSDTRVGFAVGGGIECLFHPNWSAKIEYLYYDLGSVTSPTSYYPYGAALSGAQISSRYDGHIVRAGLNYHFNFGAPGPVVAKY